VRDERRRFVALRCTYLSASASADRVERVPAKANDVHGALLPSHFSKITPPCAEQLMAAAEFGSVRDEQLNVAQSLPGATRP
jgi:hypothetical protein